MQALRTPDGEWRDIDTLTPSGAATRVYIGRDKSRAHLQTEVTGNHIVAWLLKKLLASDVYHRQHDNMVLVDRQMLMRIQTTIGGTPSVQQNGALSPSCAWSSPSWLRSSCSPPQRGRTR